MPVWFEGRRGKVTKRTHWIHTGTYTRLSTTREFTDGVCRQRLEGILFYIDPALYPRRSKFLYIEIALLYLDINVAP